MPCIHSQVGEQTPNYILIQMLQPRLARLRHEPRKSSMEAKELLLSLGQAQPPEPASLPLLPQLPLPQPAFRPLPLKSVQPGRHATQPCSPHLPHKPSLIFAPHPKSESMLRMGRLLQSGRADCKQLIKMPKISLERYTQATLTDRPGAAKERALVDRVKVIIRNCTEHRRHMKRVKTEK